MHSRFCSKNLVLSSTAALLPKQVSLVNHVFFILFCSHQIIVNNFRESKKETSRNLVWLLDDTCPVSLLKTTSTCARAFIPVLSINYEQSNILWQITTHYLLHEKRILGSWFTQWGRHKNVYLMVRLIIGVDPPLALGDRF